MRLPIRKIMVAVAVAAILFAYAASFRRRLFYLLEHDPFFMDSWIYFLGGYVYLPSCLIYFGYVAWLARKRRARRRRAALLEPDSPGPE
jgi:hypothetical protein